MENIHLIPTDKPSRLFYNVGGALLFTNYEHYNGVNIYITSDEEIKEGDWFLDDNNSIGQSYKLSHVQFAYPKKIILTTDFDKQPRVQAIDDEFLEWFVKNPSCENIKVNPLLSNNGRALFGYKIIIPKEEPNYNTENDGQTAVEWLEEQLYSAKELDLAGVIEQAKEMEKEQKEIEHDKGWSKGWDEAVKEYEKNR